MSYTRTGVIPDTTESQGIPAITTVAGHPRPYAADYILKRLKPVEVAQVSRHKPVYNPRPRRTKP